MWHLSVTIVAIGLLVVVVIGTDYELTFKTCNVEHAGTNASAILAFLGEDGTSSEVVNIAGGPSMFNRGSADKFNITLGFPGPVCSIRIKRTDAGPLEGWKLEKLDIFDGLRDAEFLINGCHTDDAWVQEYDQNFSRSDNTSGNWGSWGDWQHKDKRLDCIRQRHRACDNPEPVCGGSTCPGESTDIKCVGSMSRQDSSFLLILPVLLAILLSAGSLILVVIIWFYKTVGSAVPVKTEDDTEREDNSARTSPTEVPPAEVRTLAEGVPKEDTPEQPNPETDRPEEEIRVEKRNAVIRPSTADTSRA